MAVPTIACGVGRATFERDPHRVWLRARANGKAEAILRRGQVQHCEAVRCRQYSTVRGWVRVFIAVKCAVRAGKGGRLGGYLGIRGGVR